MSSHPISEEIKKKKAVLLDVRTEGEWHEGHAEGAIHWELARLERGELPHELQDMTLYLYCRSGGRSERARGILAGNGYTAVNIGGLAEWAAGGGKVVRPGAV